MSQTTSLMEDTLRYVLHLADNALIMSQRLSEWTGHGPALEQDIALTNIALDYLGQSRNFFQYAANLVNEERLMKEFIPGKTYPVDEDDLAYHRMEHQMNTHLLVELPNADWAQTILKVFFFSTYQKFLFEQLWQHKNSQISAIAEKSLKEVKYHVKWSGDWVLRLGDGTEESHERMHQALVNLWPFTNELFESTGWNHSFTDLSQLQSKWKEAVSQILEEATLEIPAFPSFQQGGLSGIHTEHLGYILAEMQYLQKVYPDSEW